MTLDQLSLASLIAMLVVSIIAWVWVSHRYKSGRNILPLRAAAHPFSFFEAIMFGALWVLSQALGVTLAVAYLGLKSDGLAEMTTTQTSVIMLSAAISQAVAIAAGLVGLNLLHGGVPFRQWTQHPVTRQIGLGVLGFFLVVPWVLVLQGLLAFLVKYDHPTLALLDPESGFLAFFSVWIAAGIVAPFAEEVVFRGILQGSLQKLVLEKYRTDSSFENHPETAPKKPSSEKEVTDDNPYTAPTNSVWTDETLSNQPNQVPRDGTSERLKIHEYWPVVFSALLFALVHLGHGLAPIPLFFLALALGFLYIRTNSLIACIIIHMMLNLFSLFWFTLSQLNPTADPESTEKMNACWPGFDWQTLVDGLACWL